MTHHQIREAFLEYMKKHGHTEVPPASLVPDTDPTVLFTVAGMQQFKDYYQHPEQAPALRLVNIQPCIRTIDIDEVGDDTHVTVFEMMGYFSFGYRGETTENGPYFKKEGIHFAWEFFTQILKLNPEEMRATYFGGDAQRPQDELSRSLLETLSGLSLIEPTVEDNFWGPVGSEGPCGPCVEFYYQGIEIGNVVFNEYYKDKTGTYAALEMKGVDTGIGLERLVSAVQGKKTIYDTDLLLPFVSLVTQGSYTQDERLVRIIVDHTKAALYLLASGVKPGNKGRDYIVRRLIRRAVRSSHLIGFKDFDGLMTLIAKEYGHYTPLLTEQLSSAISLFNSEGQKFLKTLQQGIEQLKKMIVSGQAGELSGFEAFKLFDTYGFPIELTQEMAEEAGWTVDLTGFEEEFAKHRQQSRAGMEKIFQGGLSDHDPPTVAHHTAHHLLLAALRQILGDHVVQRGSNVTSERLRLDVSHPEKITEEQLHMVSAVVNQKIAEDLPVISEIMDRDAALKLGALAEFGAKYPEKVSVYTIIDQDGEVFSRELCGGPHVAHTGELGRFEIIKEEASGAGLRRLRARIVPR